MNVKKLSKVKLGLEKSTKPTTKNLRRGYFATVLENLLTLRKKNTGFCLKINI